jgi:hypothetical protein
VFYHVRVHMARKRTRAAQFLPPVFAHCPCLRCTALRRWTPSPRRTPTTSTTICPSCCRTQRRRQASNARRSAALKTQTLEQLMACCLHLSSVSHGCAS